MNNLRKSLLVLFTLFAFGLNIWAQSASITVNTEYDLKTAIDNPNYSHIHLGADIVLQGVQRDDGKRLYVTLGDREVTLYMDGHSISRDPDSFEDYPDYSYGQVIHFVSGTLTIASGSNTSGSIISGGHAENGGGIYVCANAILKLDGITIQDCQAENNGGAIYNQGTVEIIQSNNRTTIQNCTASIHGGGIYNDGGSLTVSTCNISGCTATDHAGAIWNKGPLSVTNCTFTNNNANDVGGIYNAAGGSDVVSIAGCTFTNNSSTGGCGAIGNATNASTMTITDCNISSSIAGTNGGGLWNGSTVTLNNVTIENCQALSTGNEQGRGGAILNNEGWIIINGGTFQNNTSREGGAVYNKQSAMMTINSGTFTDNSTTQYGGGAVSNHGTLNVYGGTFTGNSSTGNGGGIYTNGVLNMHGNPVITSNTSGTNSAINNLYLADDNGTTRVIDINEAFTEGARIGLTPYNISHTLTSGYKSKNPDTAPDVFFFSDANYGVLLSDNEVVLNTAALVEPANYIDDDGTEKTAWTCNRLSTISDGATLNSGWYVVDVNKTFNNRITVNGDVKFIFADGKTLTTTEGIAVNENNTLTIYGQSGQSGIFDATAPYESMHAAIGGNSGSNTGTITINGGHVTAQGGGGAAGIGGAIDHDGGIITINGGVVDATGGGPGAGIGGGNNGNGGSITINGGTVTAQGGSGASSIGGGYNSNGGTITINGGIVNAKGGSNVTGIGNTGANITLDWTNLTDSYTSTTYKGTVTVATNKFFTSTDGTISSLSGTVNDNSILARKTLVPRAAYHINTICNIDDFYSNINLSDVLAFSDSIVTVTINPVDRYTCFVSAIGATSGDEITLDNSGNSYTFTMLFEEVNLYVDFKIPYLDLAGVTQYATAHSITSSTISLGDGWYAVTSNVTNSNRIQANGDVNIILCDGVTMTNSLGIDTYDGKSLNFWGQSAGTGTWKVTEPSDYANGIGDNDGSRGNISFNGGTVSAKGGIMKNGIRGETITLREGTVWAISYRGDVTLERFFSDDNNTIYEPKVYPYGNNNGTALDDKTLKPAGKLFLTEGEWSNTDNWYKGELPSINDYVLMRASATIPDGCVAQVYRVFFSDNATLTIADGGQLIYSFYNADHPTEDQFLQATVEKNIIGTGPDDWANASNGWYFITAPMYVPLHPVNSTNMLTADDPTLITETNPYGHSYDLYIYFADNAKPWYNYRQHDPFNIEHGRGYLYANANSITLRFRGLVYPYRGADYNKVTLVRNGWNLIGNPFTCKVTVDHAFAELNNGSAVDYKTSDNAIMPCAGIAVYGNAGDKVTFTMVEPDQALAPSNASLNIAVAQQVTDRAPASTIDNAIVSFNEGSTLPKFHFMEQAANIYFPKANEEYAVVGSNGQGEMPLNFKATKNGTYTITVNPEGVEMAYLHLIDNMTSADIDLLALRPHSTSSGTEAQGPASYTFTAKTTDYESRFRLVFSTNDEDGPSTSSGTFAYISNGNIIINGEGTLQVIDVMGRIIVSGDAMNRVSTGGMVPGVYVLRLINGDNIKTQKIVIE
jgi:predicted outer membrane repeat protein